MAGRNILVALDYTDESMRTVKWALDQPLKGGDTVTVLHVKPEHIPAAHSLPGPSVFAALYECEQEQLRLREQKEQNVEKKVHSYAEAHVPSGVKLSWETLQVTPSAVAVAGESGAARSCILGEAERLKPDCLVLGSHRSTATSSPMAVTSPLRAMGALSRLGFSLGKPTAEYIAEHATCPVVVVPPTPPPAAAPNCGSKSCAASAASAVAFPSAFLDSLAL